MAIVTKRQGNGEWLVFNEGVPSQFFTLEEDARNMATKLTWATEAQADTSTMAQIADRLANLETVYFDRGYNSGGSNPIIDDDVTSLGITAADLANLITFIQQLNNMLGNSAVTTGDYDATLNAVRNDV